MEPRIATQHGILGPSPDRRSLQRKSFRWSRGIARYADVSLLPGGGETQKPVLLSAQSPRYTTVPTRVASSVHASSPFSGSKGQSQVPRQWQLNAASNQHHLPSKSCRWVRGVWNYPQSSGEAGVVQAAPLFSGGKLKGSLQLLKWSSAPLWTQALVSFLAFILN